MKHLLLLVIYILPIFAFSQDKKMEKEDRIPLEEMPATASSFLKENLPENIRKLRYYYETDGEHTSYEAKFKYARKNFSVEFDIEGRMEDVEVTAEKNELNKAIYKNIETHLEKNHERYRIEKIQAQYLSKNANDKNTLNRSLNFHEFQPDNYELIVATKDEGELEKFEMLFDSTGMFVEKRKIIMNSYDYLLF